MHVLLGILAVIGGIAFWVIRANMAAKSGQELVETVKDLRNMKRSHDFRKKAEKDPVRLLDDPRIAAAAVLAALAGAERGLSKREEQEIPAKMASLFAMEQQEAVDLFAQGRWYIRELHNLDAIVDRFAAIISRHCSDGERESFIDLMGQVLEIDGDSSEIQTSAIDRARRILLG